MSKKDTAVDVVLVIAFVYLIIDMLNREATIDTQLIPSLVNGIASSTSIAVAATGLILTLAFSNKLVKITEMKWRVYLTIGLMAFSITLIAQAYENLMQEYFEMALRNSMIGLFVSVFILMSSVFAIQVKLHGKNVS